MRAGIIGRPAESAINLCDIFGRACLADEKQFSRLLYEMDLQRCIRVYVGSYFCDHYFIQTSHKRYQSILKYCKERDIAISLVIPPLFQANYAAGKELISSLLKNDIIDEVVVNDWGMLDWSNQNRFPRIFLGRLLQKDNRDPRYTEFFETPYASRLFSEFYQDFLKERNVYGVEIDCTHRELVIPDDVNGLRIAVHFPYCYISMSSICEFASMQKAIPNKFRYADTCGCDCNQAAICCKSSSGLELFRVGRSVLFRNNDCSVVSKIPYRLVYSPYQELGVLPQ